MIYNLKILSQYFKEIYNNDIVTILKKVLNNIFFLLQAKDLLAQTNMKGILHPPGRLPGSRCESIANSNIE